MKGGNIISQARINQEIRNMIKQKLPYLTANPLENDIYTWHFTIQGPENSDFHQGLYHGHILLPFQYPFKPPDILFLNKNGRFQTNTKICLTITQYHPEQWNSAWTVRTMLQAVISLFNQSVQGIGYEEGSPQQRRLLAKKSHSYKCDKCGILKDIIAPRQPMVQQQKKQEQKPIKAVDQPFQKFEYASELSFRKVKTQDNRGLSVSKNSEHRQKQSKYKQKNQITTKTQNKHLKSQNESTNNRNVQNKSGESSNKNKAQMPCLIKQITPDNDSLALESKNKRRLLVWAKVLKSQKWSAIQ